MTRDDQAWQDEQDRQWEFERKLAAWERFKEMPTDENDNTCD